MIKPVPLHTMIQQYEFVPQAIIGERVPMNSQATWVRCHPTDTSTIYLPFVIADVDKVADIVSRIASELKLSSKSITWQRKDNPAL